MTLIMRDPGLASLPNVETYHSSKYVKSLIYPFVQKHFEKKGYGNTYRRANPLERYTPK